MNHTLPAIAVSLVALFYLVVNTLAELPLRRDPESPPSDLLPEDEAWLDYHLRLSKPESRNR